jgi:hypothetical protein
LVLVELHAKGCELYLHQQWIDTRTPAGRRPSSTCASFSNALSEDVRSAHRSSPDLSEKIQGEDHLLHAASERRARRLDHRLRGSFAWLGEVGIGLAMAKPFITAIPARSIAWRALPHRAAPVPPALL